MGERKSELLTIFPGPNFQKSLYILMQINLYKKRCGYMVKKSNLGTVRLGVQNPSFPQTHFVQQVLNVKDFHVLSNSYAEEIKVKTETKAFLSSKISC